MSYEILSRVAHHDDFKSFKALLYYIYHFDEVNNTILIPNVGLRVIKAGTYVKEANFNIKIKKNRNVESLYLNYVHNGISYIQYNSAATTLETVDRVFRWAGYIRFDLKRNDTLNIKLCARGVNYEDIFESFTNSSFEIYYIDYLGLPVSH